MTSLTDSSIVSGAGMTHALANSPAGAELYSGDITIWFGFFGVLTCIANVYSIGMIAWKAWCVEFAPVSG